MRDAGKPQGSVLIMGNAFGSQAFVQAAKRMGLKAIATDGAPFSTCRAKQVADEHWDIDCGDVDELERACRSSNVLGVVSGASNFVIEREMELCDRLGLNACYSGSGRVFETDKARFKALCKQNGVPVPRDYSVTEEQIHSASGLAVDYPVVVKPTDRAGNAGVGYCHSDEDLRRGYEVAKEESHSGDVVIEEMMTGDEWYSYYAVADGEAKFISLCAMIAEPGYPKNVYSITTTSTSAVQKYVDEIDEPIRKMLSAAGCDDGIVWVQVMTDDAGSFRAIEMGYRIDGEVMIEPIRHISSFDAFEWMIEYSMGREHLKEDLTELTPTDGAGFATSYMLWVDRDCTIKEVRGLETLGSDERLYIDCVKAPGEKARQYSAIGLVDFATKDLQETIEIIKKVNDNVKIYDDEGNDVFIRFTEHSLLDR